MYVYIYTCIYVCVYVSMYACVSVYRGDRPGGRAGKKVERGAVADMRTGDDGPDGRAGKRTIRRRGRRSGERRGISEEG